MTATDERIAVAPGVELAVRVHRPVVATGAPVLAVHGLASNARLWDGMADVLTLVGHPVAAVDQRGHGLSDAPDEGYDFATLTADLVAVVDALGWEAPVVAGQSWGGNVVVELGARHAARVSGLVLVDGGTIELSGRFADWPTCEVALTPPPIAGRPWDEVEAMIRRGHADWPEPGIAGTLANLERRPDGTAAPRLSLEHHMAILRGLWEHHPSERWPQLPMPVVVVAAGDPAGRPGRSEIAKREEVERAVRLLPQGRALWIDGDHDLHAQHPGVIAAVVAEVAGSAAAAVTPAGDGTQGA